MRRSLFGLALAVAAIAVAALAIRHRALGAAIWSGLAAALVLGAGFNGASFLDFGRNYNSLIMALLSLSALGCYLAALAWAAGSTAAAQSAESDAADRQLA